VTLHALLVDVDGQFAARGIQRTAIPSAIHHGWRGHRPILRLAVAATRRDSELFVRLLERDGLPAIECPASDAGGRVLIGRARLVVARGAVEQRVELVALAAASSDQLEHRGGLGIVEALDGSLEPLRGAHRSSHPTSATHGSIEKVGVAEALVQRDARRLALSE
jgi:hypothetical protein